MPDSAEFEKPRFLFYDKGVKQYVNSVRARPATQILVDTPHFPWKAAILHYVAGALVGA